MNETIKTLTTRRSIKKYKAEQIKDEDLDLILQAGMNAPSAGNQQSAIIIAVQDPATREKVMKLNASVMGRDTDPYYGAPTILLVLADKSKIAPVEDASLVLSNLQNAAFSLGLGGCWIHREGEMFESEEGKALLKEWGVEGDYRGVGACIVGYPDCETPQAPPRKDNYVYKV